MGGGASPVRSIAAVRAAARAATVCTSHPELRSEVTVRRTLSIAVSTAGLMLIGAASAAACPSHAAGAEPEGLLGSVVSVVVELVT